ncbi:activated RNA polymerase II transcriptional coactivator p15-like [Strongylocentrotus purpuratus]|uniref:Transcriptional coactivator p15 (PC4) C-terminal domain-containing protein n=1 Tax=Strongylocentrotus purpuratus TaxID=7668 RepID=A0A7M7HJD7_STRPU|nr:activated RNA polymerase II transcriptional coactivator p15-like [Strongylocentrotus purpuratus]
MEDVPRENEDSGYTSPEPLFIDEGLSNLQPGKMNEQGRQVGEKTIKPLKGRQMDSYEKDVDGGGTDVTTNTARDVKATTVAKLPISMKDGRAKYVAVRKFRGQVYVDVRDYYESNGQYFLTKKGITLSAREFKAVLMISKNINRAIYSGENP